MDLVPLSRICLMKPLTSASPPAFRTLPPPNSSHLHFPAHPTLAPDGSAVPCHATLPDRVLLLLWWHGCDTRCGLSSSQGKEGRLTPGERELLSMQVAVSTTRPFHSALLANALVKHGARVRIYSSAPRRYFRRLDASVRVTLVPSLLQTAMHFAHVNASQTALNTDSWLYDRSAAAVIRPGLSHDDLFVGWATASLATGRAARRRGAHFVLDRACPHVDFQQQIVAEESAKLGIPYRPQPAWFRERQLAEYAEAERILTPSDYTRATFPEALHGKIVKAPLFGRCTFPSTTHPGRHAEFTVGVVGGEPVRKGYLYLLEAWERLALP